MLNKLEEEAMNFFKIISASTAHQYLASYLDSKSIEFTIQMAVANICIQGSLLWTNLFMRLGLEGSIMLSKDIIFNNLIHKKIILVFSTKHKILAIIQRIGRWDSNAASEYFREQAENFTHGDVRKNLLPRGIPPFKMMR